MAENKNDPDKTVVSPQPDETVLDNQQDETVVSGDDTVLDEGTRLLHASCSDSSATQITPSGSTTGHVPGNSTQKTVTIGSVINRRFIIEKLLGTGGMGVVYRALDKRKQEASDKNPHVAIKILGDDFKLHPKAFIALQRESRKSQDLAHPNIITVYDFDRDEDIVYMTMEELQGSPLDEFIKSNPKGIEPKRAWKIIRGIALALSYAHSKDIIHSDLKPGNIFLTTDDQIKVLDFGIARASSSAQETTGEKTQFDAGELGGLTPSYASPEMFAGDDIRTTDDIYALGLIAYELFSGKHPFSRKSALIAIRENLKPERIKGLKRHQWQAVAALLELGQARRTASADVFIKQYEGLSVTSKVMIALLVVTAGAFTITGYLRDNTIYEGPDVPFEELAPERRAEVEEYMNIGNTWLENGVLARAQDNYLSALESHPGNPEAVAALKETIELFQQERMPDMTREDVLEYLQGFQEQIDAVKITPSLTEQINSIIEEL